MELRGTRFRFTGIAMAIYGVALILSVVTTGVALVSPFAFVVTCFAAWEVGLLWSLAWVAFVHIVVPGALTIGQQGPFYMFPEARGLVAMILAASTVAEIILACLAVRLRTVTDALMSSKSEVLQANEKLQMALDEVKELREYLPICAWCKDIRDISGNWEKIESYITRHSGATFTHCLCPKCMEEKLGTLSL
jgi:hypothetical protein